MPVAWLLEVQVLPSRRCGDCVGAWDGGCVVGRDQGEDIGARRGSSRTPLSWRQIIGVLGQVKIHDQQPGRAGGDTDVVRGLLPGARDRTVVDGRGGFPVLIDSGHLPAGRQREHRESPVGMPVRRAAEQLVGWIGHRPRRAAPSCWGAHGSTSLRLVSILLDWTRSVLGCSVTSRSSR